MENIPKQWESSTLLAYNVYDNIEARTFDNTLGTTPERINSWLSEYNAIAYVEIRRRESGILTICAANPESQLAANFNVEVGVDKSKAILNVAKESPHPKAYSPDNYFSKTSPFAQDIENPKDDQTAVASIA